MLDQIHLPVPEYGVRGTAPVAAEVLPFAKGQVIQDTRGEVVVQVQLRQSPVQFRASWKRVIDRSRIRTQTVRHAGVEGPRPGITDQRIKPVACALSLRFE